MKEVRIIAPGTIGNVGPGFDVLGLCLEGVGDEFIFRERDDDQFLIESIEGIDADLIPKDASNATIIAAQAMAKILRIDQGCSILSKRSLPLAGGMGSSAAASAAGAFGFAQLYQRKVSSEQVIQAALVGETAVAGAHLDNIASCVLGGLTVCRSVSPIDISKIAVNLDLSVLLAIPNIKLETRASRAVLPENLPMSDWTRQMAYCTSLALAFERGDIDLIQTSCQDFYAEPYRGSLIPKFKELKSALLESGAIACSISGGGPSVFCLCSQSTEIDRLKHTVTQVWKEYSPRILALSISNEGIRAI